MTQIKTFNHKGLGECVLLEQNADADCSLIAIVNSNEYVVADYLNERRGTWSYGDYFKDLTSAKAYYDEKAEMLTYDGDKYSANSLESKEASTLTCPNCEEDMYYIEPGYYMCINCHYTEKR